MAVDYLARLMASKNSSSGGASDTYTKSEIDTRLAEKAEASDLNETDSRVNANTAAIESNTAALTDVLHLGIGETIPSGSDLNNYMNPGVYRTVSFGVTAALLNCPVDIQAGIRLEVALIATSSDAVSGVIQKIFPNSINGAFYMRTRSTSKDWGEWYKFDGTVAESRKPEGAESDTTFKEEIA